MEDKSPFFWIILFAIAVVVIAGVAFYIGLNPSGNNTTKGIGNVSDIEVRALYEGTVQVPEITLETTLPKVSGKIMVYTAILGIDREEVHRMANELGIRGEEKEESGFIIVQNENFQLDAELPSGVVYYKNNTEQSGYDEATIEKYLPSDEEARKIADTFLATRNLRPENAVFHDITHNEGFLSGDPPSKCWESINVDYSHEMNGYSLLTDQFRVEIGVHGTILSMFEKWTYYEPFKEYPVITPDEAINSLKKSGIVIPSGMKDPQKATVTSVTLGYIGETQSGNLPYLIPVYVFEGTVEGADGSSAAFYQWIPATPELAAEIT